MTRSGIRTLLMFILMLWAENRSNCQTPVQLKEPPGNSANTQAGDAATAMEKLSFLVGHWSGEGWIQLGPGQRRTFVETESVQRKAGGALLQIEGLGRAVLPGKQEPVTVHDAFALMWFYSKTVAYRFLAFRAGGEAIDSNAVVGDKSLVWGFRDPRAGEIRFTIVLNQKGQWFEIGETSNDGKEWRKFFEMTLDRNRP